MALEEELCAAVEIDAVVWARKAVALIWVEDVPETRGRGMTACDGRRARTGCRRRGSEDSLDWDLLG